MSSTRRILVATEFSACGRHAGKVATEWAQALGAELHWVHCVEGLPKFLRPSAAPLLTSYVDSARTFATKQIEICVEDSRELGLVSEAHLVSGRPGEAVPKLALDLDAFAIVVGSHGHTGLTRMWLGSVAEAIVRDARCAVLVVRGSVSPFGNATILVGDDLTPYSTPARAAALEIAKRTGAPVEFLHSLDLGIVYLSTLDVVVPGTLFKGAYDEAEQKLAKEAEDAVGVKITNRVVGDRAGNVLCKSAETLGAGLVAVGCRSRKGVDRALLGSVAESVVRHSPCSVLVARGAFRTRTSN